ncbi:RNA polymerase subunit sigma-70 [Pedobacter sp. PACM 27299]|uniref:RNA polymerase sigma factor n=1 Tax=Pedobacter sp. PACM 27299 TaxID=1727164 RepID=UPI000705BEDC|nr:RNA polymerase sigma-70 factor [Pedobacter sp. PACM 27299]ALL05729.1 RNA polymerase subunit sigma-70 [Pedobacter sp. PACM 27299]
MENYAKRSDLELLQLLQLGDRLAYTEIFERYKFILHHHAIKKLPNREEVKDIVQEVFTMLWTKKEGINIHTNLSGYLYTSLRHSILDHFSRQKVRDKYVDSMKNFVGQGTVLPDYRIREKQLSAAIEAEINLLPEKMRIVFELSRKTYLSHSEIATQLGISEKTVNRQISNALKILRSRLGLFAYLAFLIRY